jgi:hypothetical protein
MEPQAEQRQLGADKIALAKRIFSQYYAACFWHMRPDLDITEATIPILIKELRNNGGLAAMRAAAQLDE